MQIKNREDIKLIKDACGKLQEMYHSKNISVSYATITGETKRHKHLKMEEIYYIIKGKGKIKIGEKVFEIKPGDIVPIPKKVYHSIDPIEEPIELIVITHPRFDKNDLIQ
jgi:mannose-6-phosphate isomerase-like protein (cupin superfamily)